MPKNNQVLGIAALLLVVAAQNGDDVQHHGNLQSPYNHQTSHSNQPLPHRKSPSIDIPKLAKGVHRMASIANRFDNLGQMALNAPSALQMLSTLGSQANIGGLLDGNSNGDYGFSASKNEAQQATIPELIGSNMPDFGKLMQNLGPIISSIGNSYQRVNDYSSSGNFEQNQYIDSEIGNALF